MKSVTHDFIPSKADRKMLLKISLEILLNYHYSNSITHSRKGYAYDCNIYTSKKTKLLRRRPS